MARSVVNSIKSIPDTLLQAVDNVEIINPLVINLDNSKYTNVVQNLVDLPYSFGGTTVRASATTITPLTTTITCRKANARIYLTLFMSLETHWDNVFYITASVNGGPESELIPKTMSARNYGFASAPYDNNNDSTMGQMSFKWVHQSTTSAGDTLTYRVRFFGTAAYTVWLNQTQNAGASGLERASSVFILEEINY